MKLEEMGFYTLSDERAKNISFFSPMYRGEIIITNKCNFNCTYCRGLKEELRGDMNYCTATNIIGVWRLENLKNIRFSGGEPTLHPKLDTFIKIAKLCKVDRIALSTNGSANLDYYRYLHSLGVNDFSISFDACCASGCDVSSGTSGYFDKIVNNIKRLSKLTYVTVGMVFTRENYPSLIDTVEFAHNLGVSDIRIIPAAQDNFILEEAKKIRQEILASHPILNYRVQNLLAAKSIRGLNETDSNRCFLVEDDSAIAGGYHFPCIIYLREGGNPIGKVSYGMREERLKWSETHNIQTDPICKANCLDVCVAFNNRIRSFHKGALQ